MIHVVWQWVLFLGGITFGVLISRDTMEEKYRLKIKKLENQVKYLEEAIDWQTVAGFNRN